MLLGLSRKGVVCFIFLPFAVSVLLRVCVCVFALSSFLFFPSTAFLSFFLVVFLLRTCSRCLAWLFIPPPSTTALPPSCRSSSFCVWHSSCGSHPLPAPGPSSPVSLLSVSSLLPSPCFTTVCAALGCTVPCVCVCLGGGASRQNHSILSCRIACTFGFALCLYLS